MKGSSCALVVCVLSASTVALSSSSGDRHLTFATPCPNQEFSQSSASSPAGNERGKNWGRKASLEKENFAPRFDGLRFIETLVTAHR
ncbi:unnamed protein product [Coffea canephora]|uniref:Secreted protein n=1 Tax=Coffea canephora TaxID=49390 RepID=A0A068UXB2_COFCA|nr:unnamed protein product [Coffea canephora]